MVGHGWRLSIWQHLHVIQFSFIDTQPDFVNQLKYISKPKYTNKYPPPPGSTDRLVYSILNISEQNHPMSTMTESWVSSMIFMLIVSKNKTQSYDTIERKKETKYHIYFWCFYKYFSFINPKWILICLIIDYKKRIFCNSEVSSWMLV